MFLLNQWRLGTAGDLTLVKMDYYHQLLQEFFVYKNLCCLLVKDYGSVQI